MLRPNLNSGSKVQFVKSCAILAILVLIPLSDSLFGDEQNDPGPKEFRVDSYIPELFKDLEWKVDGGFRLNGSDSEIGSREDHYDAQNINMGSCINYRYETLPISFNIGSNLNLFYSNSNREYSKTFGHANHYTETRDDRQQSAFHEILATPFLHTRYYLFDDIYFGLDFKLDWRYWAYPEDSYLTKYHSINYYPNDYIREQWGDADHNRFRDLKYYNLDASIMPGWGRAYDGIFAATAMFLVDELRKSGILLKTPDYEQMTQLTEIIYQNRQEHAIDDRISDIDAVTAIAGYLESEEMLDNNVTGHNVITDIWKYYPEYSRRFGLLLKAGIGVNHIYVSGQNASTGKNIVIEHYYHKDSIEYKQITIDTAYIDSHSSSHQGAILAYLTVSGEYFKPLNHRWQLDMLSKIKHFFETDGSEPHVYENVNDYFDFYNLATARYILNTRTNLALSGILNYGSFKRNSKNDPDYYTYSGWHYALNLEATYRISMPTRLIVTAEIKSGYLTMDVLNFGHDHDQSNYLISASISHYLY